MATEHTEVNKASFNSRFDGYVNFETMKKKTRTMTTKPIAHRTS